MSFACKQGHGLHSPDPIIFWGERFHQGLERPMTTLFLALQPQGWARPESGSPSGWLQPCVHLPFLIPAPLWKEKVEAGGSRPRDAPACAPITDTQHRQTNYSRRWSISALGARCANSQLSPSCVLGSTTPVAPRLRSGEVQLATAFPLLLRWIDGWMEVGIPTPLPSPPG